ncbi:MAG: hypothetical protein HY706_15590 [Candidatus Hydrogenedentes bacterium]|nr:hypothetical protein [Candidatus Hydrogenedentota bacterium]
MGRTIHSVFCLLAVWTSFEVQAQFPPLSVEISPDHPLFIFQVSPAEGADPPTYANGVTEVWRTLPDELKPYSTLQIGWDAPDLETRHQGLRALLEPLQAAGIPVVLQIADAELRRIYPLDRAEELVRDFTCIKGIQASDLSFEEYYVFGAGDEFALPPNVRWLIAATDLAARYGRFLSIQLGELRWPRVMANGWCKSLNAKMRECRGYVVPTATYRGPHTVTQLSCLVGLWLEEATTFWGVEAQSHWFSDAHFVEPGRFGSSDGPTEMRSALYRAMVLNGAMTGATVFSFEPGSDLWFGANRRHWDKAIYLTLTEIVRKGLIPSRENVKAKARVAYQLAPAWTAQEFHLNLRDIDGVFDQGFLIRGAYGMERPGQIPELVLNSGRHYWVPILSPYAPQETLNSFGKVVVPGAMTSAEAWTTLLDSHYQPDGEGTAFICRVGRGIFIMHTRENVYEEQSFRIPEVPAPVRQFEAQRTDAGVQVTWPFREGDIAARVYRRSAPDVPYMLLASDLDGREYVDATAAPDATLSYSVAVLTNDVEPYEGTVNYGDYLALSTVESRLAEEVAISPLLGYGKSRPIAETAADVPKTQSWWPTLEGVTEPQVPIAQAIVARIEAWDQAFGQEDLKGTLDLYSPDYEDAQGWKLQYVRRAYQWFFERYDACRMHRQIRNWDFGAFESSGRVNVLLYCRFTGVAISDATGRVADVPAYFPRSENGEIWITFAEQDGAWRIVHTNPALPNFKDILSFSAGPYDHFSSGPDQ